MRILLAEDELISRTMLQAMLEQWGQVDCAEDGQSAIEQTLKAAKEGKPYDLICLDILMPKVNGMDVLSKIREMEEKRILALKKGKCARIVMITGLSGAKTICDSFKEQCDAYLVKPVSLEKLTDTLKQLGLV